MSKTNVISRARRISRWSAWAAGGFGRIAFLAGFPNPLSTLEIRFSTFARGPPRPADDPLGRQIDRSADL